MQRNVTAARANVRTNPDRSLGLALLVLAAFSSTGVAQRFDQFQVTPASNVQAAANLVTDPVTGVPTMIALVSGTPNTVAWNGSAFVATSFLPPAGAQIGEQMGATATGFVYLNLIGQTATKPSGGAWSAPAILNPSPSGRAFAAMTNRVAPGGRAFLFGGVTQTSTVVNDLWEFNGTSWILRTPSSGSLPSPRTRATLVSDGVGNLYLYGGLSASQAVLNDVWKFNGTQWSMLPKAPIRRFGHSMILDVVRNNFFVAGGLNESQIAVNDAWTVTIGANGTPTWAQVAPAGSTAVGGVGITQISWGALDAVRNELVVADFTGTFALDKIASALVVATNTPTATCRSPNLMIVGGTTQPRIGTSVPLGGIVGVAGATMFMMAAIVTPTPGIPAAPTPIPGSTCLNFLPASASNIATVISSPAGIYFMNFAIPNNTAFIGTVVDFQAFGANGAQAIASQGLRMAIGS